MILGTKIVFKNIFYIFPILASLHSLAVKSRIELRILLLTFKVSNNQAPSYLKELILPYHPNRALRSQTAGLLVLPRIFKSSMEVSFQASFVKPVPSLDSEDRHPLYF